MADKGLLGSITLTLCFFVLELVPHQSQAFSHEFFGRENIVGNPPFDGLCNSSIIIHGYKCHEHEVRALNIFYHTTINSFIYLRYAWKLLTFKILFYNMVAAF